MLRLNTWAVALCALLACSCAKTTQPEDLGTNTNWLQTCEETADCDGDDLCLCGVCTESCTTSAACENEATQCEALQVAACGEVSVTSACLQGCDSNADCTAVEDGRCIAGLCVPETRVPDQVPDANVPDANVPDAQVVVDGGNLPIDRFGLTLEGDQVVDIPSAYTECSHENDCVLVGTTCGCCPVAAIHTDLTDTFGVQLELACTGLVFPICDCQPTEEVPACREGRCETFIPAEDCYSPTQNLDLAYVPGAQGCACEPRDTASTTTSICLGREALICTPLPLGQQWVAVEDGPCGEPEPDLTCADGEVRATPTECIEDFELCYVLPNGEYCGRAP